MQLSEAYSKRITQLLDERNWSSYKLSWESAVPTSTVSNLILCKGKSCTLATVLNICRGLDMTLEAFFNSELFDLENLDDN